MSYPLPTLLAEKIILRDVNVGLDEAAREAVFEKIVRLVQGEQSIVRLCIELTREIPAEDLPLPASTPVTARGQLELAHGGPDLLASVTADDALSSLDFLLDKFRRQLRRQRTAVSRPVAAVAATLA